MNLEMDIDMDMDVGEEESITLKAEILPPAPSSNNSFTDTLPDLETTLPTPYKVHLRGLDNLTTDDIKSFAAEYFKEEPVSRIEWINDTSANIVYTTPAVAQRALAAFASVENLQDLNLPLLQTIPAKAFPLHPEINLEVRLAVLGDRKQAGARDRSRFYLMNPEYDPVERKKREGITRRGAKRYRDRDDGGYRSQKHDDYEDQRRKNQDGFDASLYDDDEKALSTRPEGRRSRYAERKELFPNRGLRGSGRLRDRSASPAHEETEDAQESGNFRRSVERKAAKDSENRTRARELKTELRKPDNSTPKELFPLKQNHRRSDAFDAADETADLFASRMPVPFYDGASDGTTKSRPLVSRITNTRLEDRVSSSHSQNTDGISIKGIAKSQIGSGFAIKGSSSAGSAKELFPGRLGAGNSGKELFAERLEGRGSRRRKAEDMFS